MRSSKTDMKVSTFLKKFLQSHIPYKLVKSSKTSFYKFWSYFYSKIIKMVTTGVGRVACESI